MKVGYIQRINLEYNPDSPVKFVFNEASFTRKIGAKTDKIRSKLFYCPIDYEEVESNTQMLKEEPQLILVTEPFFVDDELRERVTKWVEWANNADPKEYDFFAQLEDTNE